MNSQKFLNYKWMRVVLPSAVMPWLYQGATNTPIHRMYINGRAVQMSHCAVRFWF